MRRVRAMLIYYHQRIRNVGVDTVMTMKIAAMNATEVAVTAVASVAIDSGERPS